MFSFFSIPNEGESSINDPKVSQPKEESSSWQDSLPWTVTGETPLEWAKYELIAKRDDLKEYFSNTTKEIQENMPSFGNLGGSLPPNTCGETPEVKPMPEVKPTPQISPSTEESILPWHNKGETFSEWADQELYARFEINIPAIADDITSLVRCSGPRP